MSFCKRQQNFCITNGRIIICRPIYTRDIRFPSNHFSITETGPRFISVLIDYIRIPLIIKLSHSCFMPSFKRKHQCHIQTTITILKFFHIIIRHQLWTGSKRFIIFFTQIFCIIPNFLIIGLTSIYLNLFRKCFSIYFPISIHQILHWFKRRITILNRH